MSSLTIDHLLWRMENVHTSSEVASVHGGSSDLRVERMSYPQVAGRVRALAEGLELHFGLGLTSTVAVLAFNTREHLEMLLAAPVLGAAVNSLNVRLSTAHLLDQALHPRPAAVLVDEELVEHPILGSNARALLAALAAEGIALITVGDLDLSPHDAASIRYDDLFARDGTVTPRAPVEENTVAYHFHTSGTTGPPKTYPVTHRQAMLHALSQATGDAAGITSSDRVLPLAPFFHVNGWGLPLTSTLTGASLVLAGGDVTAERIASILMFERVTVAAGVPTVWHDVCTAVADRLAPAPTCLKEVLSGGSAVPESLVRQIHATLGADVVTAWGMTETMACSTYERTSPTTTAGKPIPLIEIRVEDPIEGVDAEVGHVGRLRVRGPFVIGAAHRSDSENESPWFDTGDIASVDHEGRLTLHDREKDLIKSGGEWIASAELEQYLCTHPAVCSAAVIPVPDPKWVERPFAYITLSADMTPGEDISEILRLHVAAKFPRWWIPDYFYVVSDLPRTAVGKIDKKKLRTLVTVHTSQQSEVSA